MICCSTNINKAAESKPVKQEVSHTVSRVVASDTTDPKFESSQSSANFILFQLYQNCVEKTKKKKEAGFGTIFLKDVAINKCLQKYEVDKFLRAGYFFNRF